MIHTKKLATLAAIATLAIAATNLSASAQSSLTNGPNGGQANTLSSDNPTSMNGKAPSRAMTRRHAMRGTAPMMHHTGYASRRPLTVRRTVEAVPVAVPVPVLAGNTGPGTIVTGPLGFGSSIVSLPFRGLNAIFPATGDVATNPLVLIGAPLHAIGDLAQIPFRVVGAPFGGTTITTY